jgi:hypothetical protein
MPSLLLTSVNAGTSASAVVIRFCSYSAVSHWVSDVSLLLFHCRAYNMTSTLRGSRSLTAATQPSAPGQPSKFQFQIINLPDPHDPVLDQFQAEVLGEFGSSLTPTQIVALRCYHPVLRQYNKVYFSTVGESHYIVVSAVSLNRDIVNVLPLPLMIGGYQIHFFPDEIFTPSDRVIYSQVDLINITIDPHRPLEPSVTSLLKHYFTLSIGARLLVFGHLVVLFPDIKSLQWTKSHTLSMPLTIGKLTYSFDVLSIAPSSHSATSNPLHSKPHACQSISTHPASESEQSSAIDLPIYSRAAPINLNDRCNMIDPDISSSALLGVKVHIPERDIIAWTSPTHAWVPTKGRKRSWKMPLMEVVRRLRFWKMCGRGKAVGQSNEDEANPLGKIIYYEGTREVVSLFHDLVCSIVLNITCADWYCWSHI